MIKKKNKLLFCGECKKETKHEVMNILSTNKHPDAKERLDSKCLECGYEYEIYTFGSQAALST